MTAQAPLLHLRHCKALCEHGRLIATDATDAARKLAPRFCAYVGQCSALKALADALAQGAGVLNGLEEHAVVCHSLDAKGVVHAADLQGSTRATAARSIQHCWVTPLLLWRLCSRVTNTPPCSGIGTHSSDAVCTRVACQQCCLVTICRRDTCHCLAKT